MHIILNSMTWGMRSTTMKLNQNQILSLESLKDRDEICESIYNEILENSLLLSIYDHEIQHLKVEIYNSFDLLVTQLITDNGVIIELIIWNVILRKNFLFDENIQKFIFASNVKAKDLLSVLEYEMN